MTKLLYDKTLSLNFIKIFHRLNYYKILNYRN